MKNSDMPAMPVVTIQRVGNVEKSTSEATGLSKREMMAMHIASGFASDGKITTDNVVKWSVEVADKLMQELDHTAK
jgi:hypothetical protein